MHGTPAGVRSSESFFLPESLDVTGAFARSERRRGIHRTDVNLPTTHEVGPEGFKVDREVMEDYALLAGTAALFAILAALMFATRHLNPAVQPPSASVRSASP